MDKTPTVVGGKKEHFGSISDMIFHWEGMECKEEEGRGEEEEEERCESVKVVGEAEHDFCSGLRVGNSKAKNINIFGVGIVSLGLQTKDECICSATCGGNCNKIMSRKELKVGIKYCPSLAIDLPVYHHIEYKPRYSAKLNHIFNLDTNTDILKTQFSNQDRDGPL